MKNENDILNDIKEKRQGEESADIFGKSKIYSWHLNTDDYKLIAESLMLWHSHIYAVDILNVVNNYVKSDSKYIFFDGTVKNLKYLVNNKHLNVDEIPDNIPDIKPDDVKILKELLRKHLKLTIDDVFDQIPNGLLLKNRFIELEHKAVEISNSSSLNQRDEFYSFLNFIIEKIPQGNKLKELFLSDEKIFKEFLEHRNELEKIEINKDRWSPQAIYCKVIFFLLYLKNYLSITQEIGDTLKTLSKKDVEEEKSNKTKLIINAHWLSLAGAEEFPWNNKGRVLTFQQVINDDFINIITDGTDLNQIYENFLSVSTNKIAKKYFPDYEEKKDGHIASLAIKKAIVVILYRLSDYCSEGVRHQELRLDGIFNKPLEYIFNENLELQNWFVKHFENELEKRIKFIKMLEKTDMKKDIKEVFNFGRERIIYLPVFESFRFYNKNDIYSLRYLKEIFHNDINSKKELLDNDIFELKNEIIKSIVFNIQKICVLENNNEWEKHVKDKLFIIIYLIFEPLAKRIFRQLYNSENINNELLTDSLLIDTIDNTALIYTILKYDASINSNFFGYIKKMLKFNAKDILRTNKTQFKTQSIYTKNNSTSEDIPDDDVTSVSLS